MTGYKFVKHFMCPRGSLTEVVSFSKTPLPSTNITDIVCSNVARVGMDIHIQLHALKAVRCLISFIHNKHFPIICLGTLLFPALLLCFLGTCGLLAKSSSHPHPYSSLFFLLLTYHLKELSVRLLPNVFQSLTGPIYNKNNQYYSLHPVLSLISGCFCMMCVCVCVYRSFSAGGVSVAHVFNCVSV